MPYHDRTASQRKNCLIDEELSTEEELLRHGRSTSVLEVEHPQRQYCLSMVEMPCSDKTASLR